MPTPARWACMALLGLALVARTAAGQPAPCPGEGFDAVGCDVDLVTAASGCAPRAARTLVETMLRKVERRVASARRADTLGLTHLAGLQLRKAADKVATLGRKLEALRARGRLVDACAQPMALELDALGNDLAALRAGSSTTTLAPSTTSSTVTTTTLAGRTTTTTTVPTCGNGRLDPGEQCDGTNLFGRDCLSLGFHGGGQLMCHDCLFDNHDCRF